MESEYTVERGSLIVTHGLCICDRSSPPTQAEATETDSPPLADTGASGRHRAPSPPDEPPEPDDTDQDEPEHHDDTAAEGDPGRPVGTSQT